ncbi:piggyBac transposable element-derived protein 1-like [Chrysoperla carnea]|uniref:piggyBac transposable element-derived protein 1-like n=1 Tax=Chrysoperla carnea TaxID=189513 RepID=UPI001D0735C2|nr:piggyBac transposable element-derived protein 1-like [Chrysoperla carnea]
MCSRNRAMTDDELIRILEEDIPFDLSEQTDEEDDFEQEEDNNTDHFTDVFERNLDNMFNEDEELDIEMGPAVPSTLQDITNILHECRTWKKIEEDKNIGPYYLPEGVNLDEISDCETPTDFFIKVMGPAIKHITFQSNLYATQKNKNLKLTEDELLSFFALNFFMGYHQLPSIKNYWSTDKDYDVPELAVDEAMILFKGRSTIKQYNPMKPVKRGYKLWILADKCGFVKKFDVYQGKTGQVDKKFENYNLGERVVLEMTEEHWGKQKIIYFDNFFTSLRLLEKLKVEGTFACGTIRQNRKGIPPTINDKHMKRGDFDHKTSNTGITFCKWMDNRPVLLASNYNGSKETTVERRDKKGEKHPIKCPEVICDYGKFMGGVDRADHLRSLYNLDRRSKKWWHRLLFGMIEISLINAYIIYCQARTKMSVLEFRRAVTNGLAVKGATLPSTSRLSNSRISYGNRPQKRKYNYSVSQDLRLSNRGAHWARFGNQRGRINSAKKDTI